MYAHLIRQPISGLYSSLLRPAGCLWEKTRCLQGRSWWPKRTATKTSVLVSDRHCVVYVPPPSPQKTEYEFHVFFYTFVSIFCSIQTLLTTSILLDNRLVMLSITSMQRWLRWVDTCTHMYTHNHDHVQAHTYTHIYTYAHCTLPFCRATQNVVGM